MGRSASEAVTVHPLAQATILPYQQREDGTAGDAIEAIDLSAMSEANANATSDGIHRHQGDSAAANGVDIEHGRLSELKSV